MATENLLLMWVALAWPRAAAARPCRAGPGRARRRPSAVTAADGRGKAAGAGLARAERRAAGGLSRPRHGSGGHAPC
jgi:hypothetical protein